MPNNEPIVDVLFGTSFLQNVIPKPAVYAESETSDKKEYMSVLTGKLKGKDTKFRLSEKHFSKNMLFIGGTGSGKTNTIDSILRDLRDNMDEDDVMIIFDTKGDYKENFFDASRGDAILGNSTQFKENSVRWNIYFEVLCDYLTRAAVNQIDIDKLLDDYDESNIIVNINEIGRSLFEANKSESQPFFANAARGIFCALMLHDIRRVR